MRYWLFYAGPENYLDATGQRNFTGEVGVWSGGPGVTTGDLAVLYRRSLIKVRVGELVEMTGMSPEVAAEIRRSGLGSDIPLVWRVVSGDQGAFADWSHGYAVELIATLTPPITLKELKAEKRLRRWQDLRWNFQAQGRDALEIPDFAWSVLREMMKERLGTRISNIP